MRLVAELIQLKVKLSCLNRTVEGPEEAVMTGGKTVYNGGGI